MAIDRAPWNTLVDDDGSNLVGTIWNKDKIKTTILDPADAAILVHEQTVDVPFNAAHYGVYPSGAWTVTAGNVVGFAKVQVGKWGLVSAYVVNSTITGTPLLLSLLAPFATLPRVRTVGSARATIAGTGEIINAYLETVDGRFYFQRQGGQVFPAGALGDLSFTCPAFLV
jgi:hypothetical protein